MLIGCAVSGSRRFDRRLALLWRQGGAVSVRPFFFGVRAGSLLGDRQHLIHGNVFNDVNAAADPADLDTVDAVPMVQTEVEPRTIVTLIAAGS